MRMTMNQVREDLHTIVLMENRLTKEFSLDTQPIKTSLDQFTDFMIRWSNTLQN